MAEPAPIRHTSAEARNRKRAVRAAKRDPEYRAWVHGRPCVVCACPGEGHHHPYKSHPGWTDRSMVPLCPEHHRGATGIHTLAHDGFQAMHGIDLLEAARNLRRAYEGMLTNARVYGP